MRMLEWGRHGAKAAAERDDVLVVVDVLSFSSTVVTAVENGFHILPLAWGESAARDDAVSSVARTDVPEKGRYSLSPHCYRKLDRYDRAPVLRDGVFA